MNNIYRYVGEIWKWICDGVFKDSIQGFIRFESETSSVYFILQQEHLTADKWRVTRDKEEMVNVVGNYWAQIGVVLFKSSCSLEIYTLRRDFYTIKPLERFS